jgi:hypothetical protein
MMKIFRCRICLRHFDVIPEDAVEIPVGSGRGHAYRMFRFTDGSIHDLRAKVVPDPSPPPQSPMIQEVPEELLPQSDPEIIPVEEAVVVEGTEEPMTAVQFAFANFRRSST